jgi:hypothetical protein
MCHRSRRHRRSQSQRIKANIPIRVWSLRCSAPFVFYAAGRLLSANAGSTPSHWETILTGRAGLMACAARSTHRYQPVARHASVLRASPPVRLPCWAEVEARQRAKAVVYEYCRMHQLKSLWCRIGDLHAPARFIRSKALLQRQDVLYQSAEKPGNRAFSFSRGLLSETSDWFGAIFVAWRAGWLRRNKFGNADQAVGDQID